MDSEHTVFWILVAFVLLTSAVAVSVSSEWGAVYFVAAAIVGGWVYDRAFKWRAPRR